MTVNRRLEPHKTRTRAQAVQATRENARLNWSVVRQRGSPYGLWHNSQLYCQCVWAGEERLSCLPPCNQRSIRRTVSGRRLDSRILCLEPSKDLPQLSGDVVRAVKIHNENAHMRPVQIQARCEI